MEIRARKHSLKNFCAQYFDWNLEDQLFHLRSSLESTAGQILWNTGTHTTVDQVIKQLRNRFGSK